MESIARTIPGTKFIRLNPTDPDCPGDITAVGIPQGNESIVKIKEIMQSSIDEDLQSTAKAYRLQYIGPLNQHPKLNWMDVFMNLRT